MPSNIPPSDLVDIAVYRKAERVDACGGIDPITSLPMYALDPALTYPDGEKINNHALPFYHKEAKILLHRSMAEVVVAAAIHLYKTQGCTVQIMDGLRTVDVQYAMSKLAEPRWYEAGMLSKPKAGAHPKGMAFDAAVFKDGEEIDMGTHVDALLPEEVKRNYQGNNISEAARANRIMLECALHKAALSQGKLIAPLRNEHWDFRFPEYKDDWWRVLESIARCIGIENPPGLENKTFADYGAFKTEWNRLFAGQEKALQDAIGTASPPPDANHFVHHGDHPPLYDKDLPPEHRLLHPDLRKQVDEIMRESERSNAEVTPPPR